MEEPAVGRYPAEVFGHPYVEFAAKGEAAGHLSSGRCPFIGDRCRKSRKSDKNVRLGTCSVGYNGAAGWLPAAICPYRLHVPEMFAAVRKMVFGNAPARRLSEVAMCVGTFDFVLVRCEGESVADFCALELQTGDTTGTPWGAVVDLKEHGRYMSAGYRYGLNMAHQYQKTAMVQLFKKGRVMESWKKHIVMLIQDIGLEFLRNSPASDASGLVENRGMDLGGSDKFIHIVPFTMVWLDDRWVPAIAGAYDAGTDSGLRWRP